MNNPPTSRSVTQQHDEEILMDRCRTAKTLTEQKRCFIDLAIFLENFQERIPSSILSPTQILAAQENISHSVLITWPYGQVSNDIDRILNACGQIIVISTCSGLLKDIAATTSNRNKNDKQSWTSSTSLPLRSIVQACWSTIQRMLLTAKTTSLAKENEHDKSDCGLRIGSLDNGSDDYDKVKSLEWKRFITGITRRSEYVAQGLMRSDHRNKYITKSIPSINDHDDDSENNDRNYTDNVTTDDDDDKIAAALTSFLIGIELLPRDMATLVLALLQYANVRGHVDRPCNGIILVTCNSLFGCSSMEHQEAITEQLVFSKASSSTKPQSIISTITTSSTALLTKHLTNIADRWSQWTFVQEVEGRQQHHVSLVLWQGLVLLLSFSSSPSSPSSSSLQDITQRELTMSLVNGVSHRLGSTITSIRQDGMRIAHQLAKGLGQDGQFEDFLSDEEKEVDDYDDIDKKKGIKNKEKIKSKQKNHRLVDPDADYDSDDEDIDISDKEDGEPQINREVISDDDGGDDDDDLSVEYEVELTPYDLEDDEEDLRETPRPLHLLEALELLRTGENHDHAYTRHEAALDALPDLIRTRPDDLKDVAVSLVLQLLRMEDKFNIHQFNAKREIAIRALIFEEPMSVGQVLIEQLFEECGLMDRLSILAALQSAAIELSGNQIVSQSLQNRDESTTSNIHSIDHEHSTVSHSNQVSRVLSNTRRKRSRSQQKSIKNRFSNIAPIWFYSLIAGFIKHKENDTLWTGSTGSILLTYFFRCLAIIVEFAGIQASQVLANDLLDLVWDFRTADVAEVRLSVLVAVSTSITMLPDERLIGLLYDEATLPRTMLDMSKRDPDADCRSICKTISYSINEALNSDF
ncbi:hypothetical protein FRACYDRAFT_232623 [Fragilariopsis cylindrus CCMP1102]|uniref:Telomere length regulation protein conserved domain-containing protein n=1 Tax=Fragilariopsis cylindrus CCMP1102 TaxID=635003 RepID=A0A1E7FWG0_9STRA|nr:hypothetical protein FRACYDRAFT_232623 [Fragilariopsis cylindrus CCMP1102]|eukprot:OEU22467.1 hypothetical protein FRACYDRAFT_232623 [Fragilariopsis cylindrus CCMP1102]